MNCWPGVTACQRRALSICSEYWKRGARGELSESQNWRKKRKPPRAKPRNVKTKANQSLFFLSLLCSRSICLFHLFVRCLLSLLFLSKAWQTSVLMTLVSCRGQAVSWYALGQWACVVIFDISLLSFAICLSCFHLVSLFLFLQNCPIACPDVHPSCLVNLLSISCPIDMDSQKFTRSVAHSSH